MTHKDIATIIKNTIINKEKDFYNDIVYYNTKRDISMLRTQPELAEYFQASINKISRAIWILKDEGIIVCKNKGGCKVKGENIPFVYFEPPEITKASDEFYLVNKPWQTKMLHDAKPKLEFKNTNSIDIYTYDELYEKYDKEFHSASAEIQDFSSQIEDCIKDNWAVMFVMFEPRINVYNERLYISLENYNLLRKKLINNVTQTPEFKNE